MVINELAKRVFVISMLTVFILICFFIFLPATFSVLGRLRANGFFLSKTERLMFDGKQFLNRGLDDKALREFSKGIELAPGNLSFYEARAEAYLEKGDVKAALTDIERLNELIKSQESVVGAKQTTESVFKPLHYYYPRMYAHFALREDTEAADAWQLISKIYSSSDSANFAQEVLHPQEPSGAELDTRIKAAQEDSGQQILPICASLYKYRVVATIASQASEKLEARNLLPDLKRAIDCNPYDSRLYYLRAIVFENIGQKDKAKTELDRAIEFNPAYARAYQFRATIAQEEGDLERAAADFKKARNLGYEEIEKN